MSDIAALVADNLDIWTSATERKSGAGRGGGKRISLYGIDRLRALILDLAVRGKLVPQDAGDEPASALLKRIMAADNQLRGSSKSKRSRGQSFQPDLPPVGDAPSSWLRVPLTHVYDSISVGNNKILSSEISKSGTFPVIDQGLRFVAGYTENRDLLIKIPGPVIIFGDHTKQLKYVDFNFVAGADGIKILRPRLINEHFFHLQLTSFNIESRGYARHFKQLNTMDFALPPLPEQQRIVAKVDELMTLCDALERESAGTMAAHQALVEILLATLVNSADAAELARDWVRLESHFDSLFTTDDSIDALKQTILDLAVRGKIVEQNPEDEPAAALLKRMNGKQKPLARIWTSIEKFDLPSGWEWVPFGSYAKDISTGPFGTMIHKSDYISGGIPLINPSHMINDGIIEDDSISVSTKKADELSSYKLKEGDIVFARRGDVGRMAVVSSREDGWLCGTGSFRASFSSFLVQPYLQKFFRSRFARILLGAESVGATMSNLNQSILMQVPIPVPPLAEQHRIVAKVDALMALCDALKARLADAAQTQRHLADAIAQRGGVSDVR